GREEPDDAKRWGWEVVQVAVGLLVLVGLPMVLVPELILSAFIHNADTLRLAVLPLRLVGLFIGADAVGIVLQNALLGAGASRQVMVVSIVLQWGLFLPVAWLVGPVLGHGLLGIWIAQMSYRALQSVVFTHLWRRGAWMRIVV
ncbi:MAG: MATE family efflux transporter, partial [Myxococcota bacterium]|nr:MATE family efflux transporter [Myxococcota bacterium]